MNTFRAEDRRKSLALATLFPYLAPALGPIVGGVFSQYISWPWLFWILSMFDAVTVICGVIILRESYKPVLLERRAHRLRTKGLATAATEAGSFRLLLPKLRESLLRPLQISVRRLIIQLTAFSLAIDFSIYVLVLSIYARLFNDQYHEIPT
jgi:omega-6 fatty acid desaturase (delta-12 desaturase)